MDWNIFLTVAVIALGSMACGFALTWWIMRRRGGVQPSPRVMGWALLLIAVIIVTIGVLAAVQAPWFLPGAPGFMAIMMGCAAMLWVSTIKVLFDRSRAGAVLVDLGAPLRGLYIGVAVLLSSIAIPQMLTQGEQPSNALFQISMAAWFMVCATGRVQVRERGIVAQGGIVEWDRVRDFNWTDPNTIALSLASRVPWAREMRLRVPMSSRREFETVLVRYFGVH